jgi:hypothetical protein
MPAWKYEIEEALEEGVKIVNSWGPKRFIEKGGKVAGIEFKRCTAVFDEKGAFNPSYDEKVLANRGSASPDKPETSLLLKRDLMTKEGGADLSPQTPAGSAEGRPHGPKSKWRRS